MVPRSSGTIRLLAVLLLALALSPVTAPFATTTPSQLFNADLDDGGPLAGPRKGPDEPAAALTANPLLPLVRILVATERDGRAAGRPRGLDARHLPLRV